jgi:hypothetical protein
MFAQGFVEYEQIGKARHQQVNYIRIEGDNNEQGHVLPDPPVFIPTRRINVRCEQVLIKKVQDKIHFFYRLSFRF